MQHKISTNGGCLKQKKLHLHSQKIVTMKKANLLTAILLIVFYTLSGQPTIKSTESLGTIFGIVTACETGLPIQDVTVKAIGTQQFTTETDATGYYEMIVEDGIYNVEFTHVGYDTITILDTTVLEGGMTEINIVMTEISYAPINVVATLDESETTCFLTWEMDQKDLQYYVVAKISDFSPCDSPYNGIFTMVQVASSYDFTFSNPGFYAFAVKAVYDCGESEWAYSNIFSLRLGKQIAFNVNLCENQIPENSEITLTGKNCPWNTYDSIADANESIVFDNITEGYYDLQINHPRYITYQLDSVSLFADTTINIQLTQNLNSPSNLYVDTLTNIATWNAPIVSADSAEIKNYYVFLDDILIDSVDANQLTYAFLELTTGKSYTACIEAKYACGLSNSTCYVWESQLLPINNNQETELINIFPNPAKNHITITSAFPISQIKINNYSGQVVFNSIFDGVKSQKINTSIYPSGVYLVEIFTDKKVVSKKIVISQ